MSTKNRPAAKSAGRLKSFSRGYSIPAESVYQFYHYLSTTLGLVGTALHASSVTGNSGAALRALAEFGGLPGLSGQAGALLHLGRSAFRSCHSIVCLLRFTVMLSGATVPTYSETDPRHPRRFVHSGREILHPIGGLCPV